MVGFNKMPGLDLYYTADVSYAAKMEKRTALHRITRRYRTLMAFERAVFDQNCPTQILLLTPKEKQFYMDYYKTKASRFHLLPPGISRKCLPPVNAGKIGEEKRRELRISQDSNLVLMVCTNFKIKGVARAITALASLPDQVRENTILLVVGRDNPGRYKRVAKGKKVLNQVRFPGARSDVPDLLMASDLLLHPASLDNTGTVIVEALAARVPVLTTDICGYSFHVAASKGGRVVPSPFCQRELNRELYHMLTSKEHDQWRRNCKLYIGKTDVFSRCEKAADVIEKLVQ